MIIINIIYDIQCIGSLPILLPNFNLSSVQSAEVAFDLSHSDPGRITIIIMSSCNESIQINFFFGGGWATQMVKRKEWIKGLPVAVYPLVHMCTCTPWENISLMSSL